MTTGEPLEKNAQPSYIGVSLEVTLNKPVSEFPPREELLAIIERQLKSLVNTLSPGEQLASSLSLPTNVPLQFQISAVPSSEVSEKAEPIPLKASITVLPSLMREMRPVVEDEVIDLVFQNLRDVQVPNDVARLLGYSADRPIKFDLVLNEETPQALPMDVIMQQECVPGSQFSWSKGCSSWPW